MDLFNVYPLMDVEPVRGEGSWIYDRSGKRYLDLYGGHAVISIGHSDRRYTSRITGQLDQLGFYSNSVQNPIQQKFADKLGVLSGYDDYQLFPCNSGAESIEVALKLAHYHTGKDGIMAFKNGFHGRTAGALAITSSSSVSVPPKPSNNVHFADLNDLAQVSDIFEKEEIGAVVVECVQGIGGINLVTTEFFTQVAELCKKHSALLVADEIQSGCGRTGKFFAFQHLNNKIRPDLITMAKGLGNGFPVGCTLISPLIKPKFGLLGSTFGGNYLASTAALAVLDIIEEDKLMVNAANQGSYLLEELSKIPEIREVRGIGLMVGIEFDYPVKSLRNKLANDHHILVGSSSNPNVLRILPSLSVSTEELDILIKTLRDILVAFKPESYEAIYQR